MADDSVKVSIDVATQAAEIALKKFQDATKKSDSIFNIFKGNLAAQFSFSAINGAISAVKDFASTAIEESLKAEQSLKNMTVALQGAGITSQASADELAAYTDELERTTTVTAEAAQETIALLANLTGLDKDGLKVATSAAADLAATLNIDLQTATTLIAKGINGNIAGFSKYGIEVKKGANETENFSNVLSALSQFQGNAAKQANTFAGALAQLKTQQGNVFEALGNLITQNPLVIAGISKLTEVFTYLSELITNNSENITLFVTSMAAAVAIVGTAYAAILALGVGIGGVTTAITVMASAFTVAWAAITGPIGLTIIGIVALGAAIFTVIKYWEDIKIATLEATAAVLEYGAKAAGVFSDKVKNSLLGEAQALRDKVQATKDAQIAEQAANAAKAVTEKQAEDAAQAEKKRLEARKAAAEEDAKFTEQVIQQSKDRNKAAEEELALKQTLSENDKAILDSALAEKLITYEEYQISRDEIDATYDEQRLALQQEKFEADQARVQEAYDTGLISKQQFTDAQLALDKKLETTTDKNNADQAKRKIAQDKKDKDALFQAQQERLRGTADMFGALSDLAATGGEKLFKVSQGLAYAEATVNGIAAIQAAAKIGFPQNVPGIIIETARMATSLIGIKRTKPSFATGGVMGGFNGASLGPDNTTANVRTGEMILNAAQQRNLFDIANSGQSDSNQPTIIESTIIVQVREEEIGRAVSRQVANGLVLGQGGV